jgi:hypothetical protein
MFNTSSTIPLFDLLLALDLSHHTKRRKEEEKRAHPILLHLELAREIIGDTTPSHPTLASSPWIGDRCAPSLSLQVTSSIHE